jgi:hypothetical protein
MFNSHVRVQRKNKLSATRGQASEKRSKPSSSDLGTKSHSPAAAVVINYPTVYDEMSRSRNKTLGLILVNIDVSRSCMVVCILMAYGIYLCTYGGACPRAEWLGDWIAIKSVGLMAKLRVNRNEFRGAPIRLWIRCSRQTDADLYGPYPRNAIG